MHAFAYASDSECDDCSRGRDLSMTTHVLPTGQTSLIVQFQQFLLLAVVSLVLLRGPTTNLSLTARASITRSAHFASDEAKRKHAPPPPQNVVAAVPFYGKAIIVSLARQWLYAYQNQHLVFNAAVLTGRPALPTPQGFYRVYAKLSPATFTSPWPPSSPYWYPATKVQHALAFRAGGYFLHDSYWHTVYGPGTNKWHHDPVYGWQWGSHGCISMPDKAASRLYNWAPIGTPVRIVA